MASGENSAIVPSQQPSEENRSVKQEANGSEAPIRGDSGNNDIIGKKYVGQVINKCGGFRLIMVKLNDNEVLKGWIPDVDNLHPITLKNDFPPEHPMVQPCKVRKRASSIQSQSPIPMENLTFVLPKPMFGPFEEPTTVASWPEPVNPKEPPSAVMVNPRFSETTGDIPAGQDEPEM